MVHHCVYKGPPLLPIMSQMNPVHTLSPYLFNIHLILSFHICQGLASGLFPSGFLTRICLFAFLIPVTCTMFPTYPILHDLITLIFGEEYKLWSSLLNRFLQACHFFLGPHILSIHSQPASVCVLPIM